MFIAIYITHENMEAAEAVVRHLLEKRLIACANTFPIRSAYWWKGRIEKGEEVVSLVKTRRDLWEAVKAEVEKVHPYELPCITRWECSANETYEAWVESETRLPGH